MKIERSVSFPVIAFFTGILISGSLHAQAPADKPVIKGTFLGDGKDAKIQYLLVTTREPFSDKGAIRLIFTEKIRQLLTIRPLTRDSKNSGAP